MFLLCKLVKLFLCRAGLHVLLLQGSHWRSEDFLYCLRSDARAKPRKEKRGLASEFPLYWQHKQSVRFQKSACNFFSFSGVSCLSERKPKCKWRRATSASDPLMLATAAVHRPASDSGPKHIWGTSAPHALRHSAAHSDTGVLHKAQYIESRCHRRRLLLLRGLLLHPW